MEIKLTYPQRMYEFETQFGEDSRRWGSMGGLQKCLALGRTVGNVAKVFATIPGTILYVLAESYRPLNTQRENIKQKGGQTQ